jgi:membrane protease YdiL (CAAX protease family)
MAICAKSQSEISECFAQRGTQSEAELSGARRIRKTSVMESDAAMTTVNSKSEPIAPWWHTLLVLVPIAIGSIASWYEHGLPNAHLPGVSYRLSSYITVLLEEWFVVLLIWLALKRRGISIGSLVSGHWQTLGAFFRDLGLAVGFLVIAVPLIGGLMLLFLHFFGGNANSALTDITPKTALELVAWLGMSATAGFSEELIFRGYLTRQFNAWTGSLVFAVILQGIVFGLAHGYYHQGMVVIMVQGWLLGLLACWRKSLRPGMLGHGLQDAIGGVVAFLS